MYKFLSSILLVTTLLVATQTAMANSLVNCSIEEQGVTKFNGKCSFKAEKGGSFDLTPVNRNAFLYRNKFGAIVKVSVTINSGRANGIFSTYSDGTGDWDEGIKRSKGPGCWESDYTKVCAWK